MPTNKLYAYWLCSIPGVGNRTITKLLEFCKSPEEIYHARDEIWEEAGKKSLTDTIRLHRDNWNLEEEYHKMEEMGIRLLLQEDDEYPNRLRTIPDAPFGLFVKGKVPEEERMSVAVIGARDCSEYGSYVANELGRCLGENGIQVISGMARGIDGISQKAAIYSGGVSFAVLGSGVDVCYPKQNRELYDRLMEQGGILSICAPGTQARPQNFPPRNRIVSGLADVVVVIEARNKSGTLITVDMALEQGREVYVVPGRITDRLSDGCNRLLRQGAEVLLSPGDFLDEILQADFGKKMFEVCEKQDKSTQQVKRYPKDTLRKNNGDEVQHNAGQRVIQMLPSELQKIWKVLDFYPQSMEQISSKLSNKYTVVELNMLLMRLCMEGHAIQLSPGYFCVKR